MNLCPHPVTVYDAPPWRGGVSRQVRSWPASESPARVIMIARWDHARSAAFGVPIRKLRVEEVQGLPPYNPNCAYIVSALVLAAVRRSRRTSSDLLTPGPSVKDSSGKQIGCMGLYYGGSNPIPEPESDI